MSRITDYLVSNEITNIIESLIEKFPELFEGFDPTKVKTIISQRKGTKPLKLMKVRYPLYVFTDALYVVEAFSSLWAEMDNKKRNLAVFHIMCSKIGRAHV